MASLAAPIEVQAKVAAFPEKIGISYDDGYKNTVIIETDSEAGSDTDANISIALYGNKYRTDAIALQGNFEAGIRKRFIYLQRNQWMERGMDYLGRKTNGSQLGKSSLSLLMARTTR